MPPTLILPALECPTRVVPSGQWALRFRGFEPHAGTPCPRRKRYTVGERGESGDAHARWSMVDTVASKPCDDPELGKMGADRINHFGLLPDEERARATEHQAALLLGRLGRHEPHVGPGDRFADCLGVGGIVLLPLDVGFT